VAVGGFFPVYWVGNHSEAARGDLMQFVASGPIASLWASLLLFLILFICGRIGGIALHVCDLQNTPLTQEELSLFSVGVGVALLSLSLLFLGSLKWLYAASVWALLGLLGVLPFIFGNKNCFSLRNFIGIFRFKKDNWGCFLPVLFILFLSWVQALAPPIAMDALAYHLDHAKYFVLHHATGYVPFARESLWPYQTEMLFTLGLLLQGTTLAQLFHWCFYGWTAIAVYFLGKRLFEENTAKLAALVFLLTPAAFAQSGAPYVDLSFAFFVTLAVYPLVLYRQKGKEGLIFLSGLMAGAACGTKMLGLGCAFVIFILWVSETKARPKTVFLFLIGCFLTGSIWYLRSWLILGNPVYPFFAKYFGGHGYDIHMSENVGRESGFLGFVKLFWNMTFYPRSFGGEMLGPLFLLFVPLLVFHLKKISREALRLAVFTFFYTFFLYKQSQHLRFYLSVVPFLSIAAAYSFDAVFKRKNFLKATAIFIFLSVAVIHAGIFLYRVRNIWDVDLGRVSGAQYLSACERSFRLYAYLKEKMKPGETFFNAGEVRHFYDVSPDTPYDSVPLRRWLETEKLTLTDYLAKNRFDYILLQEDTNLEIRRYVLSGPYKEIFSYFFYEKPVVFHYSLYCRKA